MKLVKVVAWFNCGQAHFQSTPMLQTKQITRGHNLREVRGKYIQALRNPKMFLHFIIFLSGIFTV